MSNQYYIKQKQKCWEEFLQKHEISRADGVTVDAFIMAFDRAYDLGKQEKDAEDTVTIDKEEYDELCKYRRYAANWAHGLTVCSICGEYNPSGYICANCNNDKNWNDGE